MDGSLNGAVFSPSAQTRPKRPGSQLHADIRHPSTKAWSGGRPRVVDHRLVQPHQHHFDQFYSNRGEYQAFAGGDYYTNPSGGLHVPSLGTQPIDREPASAVDVSLHRPHGPGGGNRVPSLPLGPTGLATQISYFSHFSAGTGANLPGSFTAHAPSHTWPVGQPYHELTGGVSPPLSAPSGTESLFPVRPTAAYKPHTQQLSRVDPQQPVPFAQIPLDLESTADCNPPTYTYFTHPAITDTGVPGQTISHSSQNTSFFHSHLHPTVQTPSHFTGYLGPNSPQNYSLSPFSPSGSPALFTVDSHRGPVDAMLGHRHEDAGYVNIVTGVEARAMAPAPSTALSDVDETVVVDELPDTVQETPEQAPREKPYSTLSQNGSVVDLSCPRDTSPDKVKPPGSPPRDFVNLSLRHGQLYDEKKGEGVTNIIAHSFVEPNERKQRGPLTKEQREAAGKVRKMRACFRCHSQRIRCESNEDRPDDPDAPCLTCLRVSQTRKVIHILPCVRLNVTSIVLYRSGGLNLTRRWEGTRVMDIGDWADESIRDIKMSLGISRTPMTLRVRKFLPIAGDILTRRWVDNGVPKEQELPPYALADTHQTAADFKKYLRDHAFDGLTEAVKDSDELIRRTYSMVLEHYASLPDEVVDKKTQDKKPNKEKKLMADLIEFSFSIRHMTGSSWICGEETLGMEPCRDPTYPLRNKLSLPRMIIAQMDSIQCDIILKKSGTSVLRQLLSFIYSNNPANWFTIYLVIFMLLHEISHSTKDRRRHAQQNRAQTRYGPLGQFVERMQEGANILLGVWQYYKCVDLMTVQWDDRANTRLKCLRPEQAEFVKSSTQAITRKLDTIPTTPEEDCWEHPLYFVSHMFSEWSSPLRTYNYVAA